MDLFSPCQKLDSYKLLVYWYADDEYSTVARKMQVYNDEYISTDNNKRSTILIEQVVVGT